MSSTRLDKYGERQNLSCKTGFILHLIYTASDILKRPFKVGSFLICNHQQQFLVDSPAVWLLSIIYCAKHCCIQNHTDLCIHSYPHWLLQPRLHVNRQIEKSLQAAAAMSGSEQRDAVVTKMTKRGHSGYKVLQLNEMTWWKSFIVELFVCVCVCVCVCVYVSI